MNSQHDGAGAEQTRKLRELNVTLRREMPHGHVIITRAVGQLELATLLEITKAVREFDAFTADDEPWDEHDFGQVIVDGQSYFWKIYAHDPGMASGSTDTTDEAATRRIIRIMTENEL